MYESKQRLLRLTEKYQIWLHKWKLHVLKLMAWTIMSKDILEDADAVMSQIIPSLSLMIWSSGLHNFNCHCFIFVFTVSVKFSIQQNYMVRQWIPQCLQGFDFICIIFYFLKTDLVDVFRILYCWQIKGVGHEWDLATGINLSVRKNFHPDEFQVHSCACFSIFKVKFRLLANQLHSVQVKMLLYTRLFSVFTLFIKIHTFLDFPTEILLKHSCKPKDEKAVALLCKLFIYGIWTYIFEEVYTILLPLRNTIIEFKMRGSDKIYTQTSFKHLKYIARTKLLIVDWLRPPSLYQKYIIIIYSQHFLLLSNLSS